MTTFIRKYLGQNTDAAPLVVVRIFFGAIMVIAMIRFKCYGWIEKLYIEPELHFKYYGFEWVKPLGEYTYWLFFICGAAAFLVMIGWQYRIAIVLFFLSFTYIELMDKTNYLNHYYFVSCFSFLLCFLPANACFSIDAKRKLKSPVVPSWTIDVLRVMMCIVWFYAGLAKLNSDWLLHAQPLSIWLKAKYDIPVLGSLLQKDVFHYIFSWSGAVYDLMIPFLLWNPKTRLYAFIVVVVFHVLTWILFPIGIFPWVMIVCALIFFDGRFFRQLLKLPSLKESDLMQARKIFIGQRLTYSVLTLFLLFQLVFPFRHLLYNDELFWTEQGYRFSWRVMLMEKAGYANFKIIDTDTGSAFYVDNSHFLNPLQEKQMSTQPDFILEYACFLEKHYQQAGIRDPQIYVESYVALNGRTSQPYVNPDVDLTTVRRPWTPAELLSPFNDTIRGM